LDLPESRTCGGEGTLFHPKVGHALLVSTPGEPSDTPAANDHRLRRIESVTNAALAHLDVEDLLGELLDRVRELLEVDTASVLLLDSSSQQLVATAAR
jgi:transcriptional regulator with GAF, ATPase, and Fis domain